MTATEQKPEVIDAKVTDALPSLPAEPQPQLHGWLRIIDRMIDKGVDAALLTQVFELQQKSLAEIARKEFVEAFSAFKAEAPAAIERTGSVSFGVGEKKVGYNHVELDVACLRLTPLLSKHGLAHSWETTQDDKGLITVSCRLEHTGGHSRIVTLRGMPDASGSKNPIQAVGSTIYYLERYAFLAVLGIAQKHEDNDGTTGNEAELIGPEQIQILNEMLEAKGKDLDRFLSWAFNVPMKETGKDAYRLDKLTMRRFREACAAANWPTEPKKTEKESRWGSA